MTGATSSVALKEPCKAPRTVRTSDQFYILSSTANATLFFPLSSFKLVNFVKTFVPYHHFNGSKSLCVIKSEISVRMCSNTPNGNLRFQCACSGLRPMVQNAFSVSHAHGHELFFKTIHTIEILEGRPLSVWQYQFLYSRPNARKCH